MRIIEIFFKRYQKAKGIKYVGFGKEKADHGEPWGDGY